MSKLREMVKRIIKEESFKSDAANQYKNDPFVPIPNVRKGSHYMAFDSGDPNSNPDHVIVTSIKKDQSGEYEVDVKFVDNMKTDSWYLSKGDKVFKDWKKLRGYTDATSFY